MEKAKLQNCIWNGSELFLSMKVWTLLHRNTLQAACLLLLWGWGASGLCWAQEKKPNQIKGLMKPKDQGNPLLIKEPDNAFLKNMGTDKTYSFEKEKPQGKALDMQPDEKFLDPAEDYLRRLKTPQEREKSAPNFKEDQYLGDLRSDGKFVRIIMRDHEHPDGDLIQVLVNDEVVHPSILLETQFKVVQLDLDPGFNKIDFLALNQGESGPNTAEVRVFEEDGSLVAAKRWNLATGVKATYIVVKE